MATHLSFPVHPKIARFPAPAKSAAPLARSTTQITMRGMRRVIPREQGAAMERIGHAVDYLNDSYIAEGAEQDILDFRGSTQEAIHILIAAQRGILHSLPLTQTWTQRFWNLLLGQSRLKTTGVLPLSSFRP